MGTKALKFLVDECTVPNVANWLKDIGYTVFSVFDENAGINDLGIIKKAQKENWVIITNDKDFGDFIFRDNHRHYGVILLRLQNEKSANKISCLEKFLVEFYDRIENNFIVITERNIRITKSPNN